MELEFDKEIDALMRKAAQGGAAFSAVSGEFPLPHLDADEIAAFSENALPAFAKEKAMAHLADCSRCRKILAFSIEPETEPALEAAVREEKSAASEVSWWKKMFVFPGLAYSMGALALVMTGLTAYIVLQKSSDSKNFDVARKIEEPSNPASSGPNASGYPEEAMKPAAAANAPAGNFAGPASNGAKPSAANAASAAPFAPSATPFATASGKSDPRGRATESKEERLATGGEEDPLADKAAKRSISEIPADSERSDDKLQPADGKLAEKDRDETKKDLGLSSQSTADATKPKALPAPALKRPSGPNRNEQQVAQSQAEEKKQLKGKTFRKAGSVWIDDDLRVSPESNLMQPSLKKVSRGTSEYKKLDKGLQEIGNSLSGTVNVLWKGKGYSIQ